jgi:hypothetical protein
MTTFLMLLTMSVFCFAVACVAFGAATREEQDIRIARPVTRPGMYLPIAQPVPSRCRSKCSCSRSSVTFDSNRPQPSRSLKRRPPRRCTAGRHHRLCTEPGPRRPAASTSALAPRWKLRGYFSSSSRFPASSCQVTP